REIAARERGEKSAAESPGTGSELGQDLGDSLLQFLARLELDDRAGRNGHRRLRLVGIAPDLRLGLGDLKGAEVAEHDVVVGGETGGHFLNEGLHDVEYFLLSQSRLVADAHDEISLGNSGHG